MSEKCAASTLLFIMKGERAVPGSRSHLGWRGASPQSEARRCRRRRARSPGLRDLAPVSEGSIGRLRHASSGIFRALTIEDWQVSRDLSMIRKK